MVSDKVTLAHGAGGKLSQELMEVESSVSPRR